MSSQVMPGPARAPCWPPRTGAMPKTSGSTPWTPRETTRASGARADPLRRRLASRAAASTAPSFSGEELPAVTVPSLTKAGFSLPSFSSEVSARMPSSRSSSTPGTGTTHRRSSPRPRPRSASCVAAQRELVLRLARDRRRCRRASRRFAEARSSTARASRGLTIRQPSVRRVELLVAGAGRRARASASPRGRGSSTRPRRRRTIDGVAGLDRPAAWIAASRLGAAEAVDGGAGDAGRQAGEQRRPSGRRRGCPRRRRWRRRGGRRRSGRVEVRGAVEQRAQRVRREVVGADLGQRRRRSGRTGCGRP